MKSNKTTYKNRLLTSNSVFAVSEAYRTLRTNLMYTGSIEKCPVYAVTSSAPNEGKTLNCINIALSYAQIGKKTLVIDLDMRNPSQHIALEADNRNGVSEFLAGVSDAPCVQKTIYENLHLISGGRVPPDPSELLYSPRFEELLTVAKEKYDVIFLDLPPIGIVSDAAIIAKLVTGYIIVLEAGVSDTRYVLEATNSLESVKANIVGFILNGVDPKQDKYYAKYGKNGKYANMYGVNGAKRE